MPSLTISIPHELTQEEAVARIKSAVAEAKAKHANSIKGLEEKWDGNNGSFSGSVMGQAISGAVEVKPSEVELKLELPFAVTFFKGAIENGIRESATKLLKG